MKIQSLYGSYVLQTKALLSICHKMIFEGFVIRNMSFLLFYFPLLFLSFFKTFLGFFFVVVYYSCLNAFPLKIRLKSSHQIIVAWSGVIALCLYGIPAFGLAAADADDQGAVHFNQGETGTITFTVDLDGPQSATPYFIIRIDPNNRPFCVNGLIDESFVLPNKFSVNSVKSGQRFHVRLLIESICVQDQGVYILEVIPFNTAPN